ncbi:unnamed protein product, partial [Strongylus vulgaris]
MHSYSIPKTTLGVPYNYSHLARGVPLKVRSGRGPIAFIKYLQKPHQKNVYPDLSEQQVVGPGLTLTEKWNTENQLGTVIEVNEQFGRGLKLTFDSLYAPHAGKRTGKLKADWATQTAR